MFQILVVEDDKELNHTVCAFLNQSEYEATGCLNAADAYDAMYGKIFDLDVYMTKLRNKLSDCDSFEIVTVHGLGYKAVLK